MGWEGAGGTYLPTFVENMGLVIRPNLHRYSEGEKVGELRT